jgi:hypothetical protein
MPTNRERERVSAWIEVERWHAWAGGTPRDPSD